MSRIRSRKAPLATEAVASAELAQAEVVRSVMVVRVLAPVWLHTHKAKRGDVVTVDPELGRKLIAQGQAEGVRNEV